jgi:hypothetical protein
VDRLVEKIRQMLRGSDGIPDVKLLPAYDVIRVVKKNGHGVGRFFRDVLDGKISPAVKHPRRGLSGFAFIKEEASAYLEGLRVGRRAELSRLFDYKMRARALGVMRERNLRMNKPGGLDRSHLSELIGIDVNDLAQVAREVFSRAIP